MCLSTLSFLALFRRKSLPSENVISSPAEQARAFHTSPPARRTGRVSKAVTFCKRCSSPAPGKQEATDPLEAKEDPDQKGQHSKAKVWKALGGDRLGHFRRRPDMGWGARSLWRGDVTPGGQQ